MSGESEQEYFADGISEDIITDLSRVSALSVISRNSAFMYKGKHIDLPKVARELKVSHVLEGSVRKSGHRVRITAQLINGATNEHVWAERFDRDLNDIFAVQDEISEAIVKALKVRLLPEEKKAIERRGTDNVEAWSLVAEARQYLLSGRTSERYFRAVIRFCEQALALDPNFAEAWATIAQARNRLSFDCGFADEDGFDAANRALALDDKLSLAHAALAMVYSRRNQVAEAEAAVAKALELEPDRQEVVRARAAIYFRQRKFREALDSYERAALLKPTDASTAGMMNTCAAALGDQEAVERSARMIVENIEPLLVREPDNTDAMGWLVAALAALKQTERVQYWINRALMFDPANFTANYNFACALIHLGAFDRAIDLLRNAMNTFTRNSYDWMKADPDIDALRDHPGYVAFVAELEAKLKSEAG
jgi:adenylate cyclase